MDFKVKVISRGDSEVKDSDLLPNGTFEASLGLTWME